jgi:prepilin-type N-terminal cleavage/methylation domain-containing protein
MARKYTILKVIIQNFSRVNKTNKGFTLIELIVGLSIMLIVGGLAMNALIQASISFNKDKKSIDSSQSMSAILEIIGNDIRQAGEGINDSNFPAIEFGLDAANTTAGTAPNTINPQASSRITIRRSVQPQLTLCEPIAANVSTLPTQLIIANSITGTHPSCIFTYAAPPSPAPAILPTSGATPPAWLTAINAREYRCQLDTPNSNYLTTSTDLCAATKPTPSSSDREQLRAAVSNGNGRVRFFNYSNDNFLTFSSNYYISVGSDDVGTSSMSNDNRNKDVEYPPGSPIYLIEERVYALNNNGKLTLSINGGPAEILSTNIAQFNISARLYTDATDRVVNPTPTVPVTTAASGSTPATTTIAASAFVCPTGTSYPNQPISSDADLTNPQYVCQFNYNTLTTDVPMKWKTIAGVRVSLQAKYDGTGQNATANDADKKKIYAAAEFFPRNVLSK